MPNATAARGAAAVGLCLAAAVGMGAPRAARAQLFGFGAATEWTQIANNIQLVNQYARQGQQLARQIQQYQDQVQNTARVPAQVWGQTLANLQQVNTLLAQARSLAYTSANLNQQFGQRYKTYGVYAGQALTPATLAQKYVQWSAEANDNALYALRAANTQSTQMATEDADLQALERMAVSASGRMQAIQVGNQFAAQSARQVQKLRQLMMLQMQVTANAHQLAQDRDAYQQAASTRARARAGNAAAGGQPF